MSRIHLLTPNLVPGDAVSTDVLAMRRWLRQRGHETHVYAGRCHPAFRGQVRPLKAYEAFQQGRDDLLIYHHSVGWPAGLALYQASHNRRIVRYHNVTPAVFYKPYNIHYVRACRQGERETRRLAQSSPELFLADSEFNAQGLVAFGADPGSCRTVPPFHSIARLDNLPADATLAAELQGRSNWLFVGRLSPNKGQRHLIRALGYFQRYLGGQAHLLLVGGCDSGLIDYNEELRAEVRHQRLEGRVHFVGKVSDRALKTYYTHGSVFVCASEHEGFCVPLAEAMHFGIPIVAYSGSAVGFTLSDAALTWETPSPALLAESVRLIEERPEVRAALVRNQRARFQSQFTTEAIGLRLQEALLPLLDSSLHRLRRYKPQVPSASP
jgi:glycosyltransferase involved in cell wall biosynthesis